MSVILLVAAIVAGVIAVAQIARQTVRLREELEELRSRTPEPAQPAKARADVRPLFGELYEDRPGPFEGIANWPGVPLACAAAGLFAMGLVAVRPGRMEHGPADSTVAVELAAARLRHDSLASAVDRLRDSLAVLEKRPAGAAASAVRAATPRRQARAAESASLARSASPEIAPMPSLPKP